MKTVNQIAAILAVAAGILILLISSVEIAAYSDFSYYQKEYEKYSVTEYLDMEMVDVMYVTREMMSYLKGEREELSVMTTIEGQEQDFFNEQDRIHMYDVQQLFIGGMKLRTIAIVVMVLCVAALFVSKRSWGQMLCRTFWVGLGVLGVVLGLLAFLFATDFTRYFTIFHEIFFNNDLWIFDPATDYMIRMLPEGFFYDMAARIVIVFSIGLVIVLAVSIAAYRRFIRNVNEKV